MTKSKTIQDIITESQEKRHKNHVEAGKKIKEKWINQGKIDALNEVLEIVNKIFYLKGKDIHPPFKEIKTPIISIDKLFEFEKQIKRLKNEVFGK